MKTGYIVGATVAAAAIGFGVYMVDLGLLARSVWILDQDGKVAYKEVVPEMATEPNYDAALSALQGLLG